MPLPSWQVLELESLGVRVRNTKRFFVLNPTSISYEFSWTHVGPPLAAQPGASSPFVCGTRKGTIDGGRWGQ
jgi:hydrocephalus-inducing protein